ncbi:MULTISPECIES: MFS transporter [Curtobacterium]|uniref:MFS transporter n=1 Tax=Curtobacterium TaxID=2034 RepID=UPI001BDEF736|nr:MFS transporter [Curtobacterium flaccumfaciens]MBT1679009.1 MFS transporter [Curtobacterium flaccumfaciens pv. flaccumfaciens]QYI96251.1 MFS transporter [Curtobacterium flaccumfaciens pv. flaccumfaciens]
MTLLTSHPRAAGLALSAVLALQLMLQIDAQVMTVALPAVQAELGFTAATLSWVPNAYALAFGGLILLGGRLGDALGRVRVFSIGTAVFVAGSLVGGFAIDPSMLVAARILQGVGAAVAAPSVLALIATMAKDAAARARGLAWFTSISAIGSSVGLVLGGLLTDLFSWRWGLLINVPVGIVVVLLVMRLVRETDRHRGRAFDVPGAVLASLASAGIVWAFISAGENGWVNTGTIAFFVISIALVTALVVVERRAANPLVAVHLLKDVPRAGALVNMGLTVGANGAMLFFIVQYLQRVLDFGPLLAGIAFLPLTATVFIVTRWVPGLVARFGARIPLVIGGVLVTAGFLLWVPLTEDASYIAVVVPLIIQALGFALIFTAGTLTVMNAVPESDTGSASGMLQMVQQVGGSIGIAVAVSVYAGGAVEGEFLPGFAGAMLAGAGLSLLATIVAIGTVRRSTISALAVSSTPTETHV